MTFDWPSARRRTSQPATKQSRETQARRTNERRGRVAEWLAAALLIAEGYRILARRAKTPFGEIDLIGVRRRRLAFVEVKRRETMASAEYAVSRRQADRIRKAAEHWTWRHARYRSYEIGLDCIFVTRRSLPRHVPNVLQRH